MNKPVEIPDKYEADKNRYWKVSLSAAPFVASLLVICSLALFIGIFWTVNEYQAYRASIENIKKNYNVQYKARVRERLDKVVDFIDYERMKSVFMLENDLREKVQSAYSMASHMNSLREEESVEEIKTAVIELLRPVRWSNGRGFYFVGSLEEGRTLLFADDPFFEKKNGVQLTDKQGINVTNEMINLIKENDAGLFAYDLVKPAFPGKSFPLVSFVKHYQPFGWYIGAAMYSEDLENSLKSSVLERVQQMSFGKNGDVIGCKTDGTIVLSTDQLLVGRSIQDINDYNGKGYGGEILKIGLSQAQEGYLQSEMYYSSDNSVHQKLNYVRSYDSWGWIISTGMYMDEMERAIEEETQTYKNISFRNVATFIIMFTVAVFLLLFAAYIYSRKIGQGFNHFIEFFRKAADSKVKIKNSELPFTEFETLGELANVMVENRIQNELILKRNEQRLDTLLQLGMMERYNVQEKYDFILQRVIEITGSTRGYLALVNDAQNYLSFCSYFDVEDGSSLNQLSKENKPVSECCFAAEAISKKKPIITKSKDGDKEILFPYTRVEKNYLELPLVDGEKVVLVCGVCNTERMYTTSDIKQMTMLLDGLWMHVLATCAEKELANLERQVIAVSQKERSRIGQDLHDGLCSHLGGVELLSKALQQKLEKESRVEAAQLGVIRDLIREAIEKTGQLARGLYPVHVIDQGLEAALEELLAEIQSSFAIKCNLDYSSDEELGDINIVTHLYYIIREAVFNSAKHGEAKEIKLDILCSLEHYRVSVKDNGKGFDDNQRKKGMGFHTMNYRAKAIGGTISISSKPEQGTEIVISGEVEQYV